jgi:PTS system ascorbate-specific IIC component
MFLAELMPAFKGWSERIIPGAVPAFDVPVYYSFAPTASVLGFLGNFIGEFCACLLQLAMGFKLVGIPGGIPIYFGGSLEGVIGNAFGGWRAAIIAGFLSGFTLIFLGVFRFPFWGITGAIAPQYDYNTLWWPVVMLFYTISGGHMNLGP